MHDLVAELAAEAVRLHVVVAAVTEQADDEKVGAGEEDTEKDQLAYPVEARFVGEVFTQVADGEDPDLFLPLEKEQADKDHDQTEHEGGAEDHVDHRAEVGVLDVPPDVDQYHAEQEWEADRGNHGPDQRNRAACNPFERNNFV